MRLTGAVILMILRLFIVFGGLARDASIVTYVYLALIAAALLWGAHVHFAERCPACGTRIGSWFGLPAYFGLPRNCKQCGIAFE